MKVKVSVIVITALLTVVATIPASTYVPSPDELARIVGGDGCGEYCKEDMRCDLESETACSDHQDMCDDPNATSGMSCKSFAHDFPREDCYQEQVPKHICSVSGPETLDCIKTGSCECRGNPGYLTCYTLLEPSDKVAPCTQEEF